MFLRLRFLVFSSNYGADPVILAFEGRTQEYMIEIHMMQNNIKIVKAIGLLMKSIKLP